MSLEYYPAIGYIGGAPGDLDIIPSATLDTGDVAVVTTSTVFSVHYYDATSSAAESSPDVIAPDDIGAGSGRWLLVFSKAYVESGNFDARVKAWIQFNGTGTIAIQDSFNVNSIVDDGVGDYGIIWGTAFANDDYAIVGNNSSYTMLFDIINVAWVNLQCYNGQAVAYDPPLNFVIAIGDQ